MPKYYLFILILFLQMHMHVYFIFLNENFIVLLHTSQWL